MSTAVNPRLEALKGTTCNTSLADILVKVDVVDFVVLPNATEEVLGECKRLEIDRI
jgi:predicted CoA-binding protein